MSDMVDEKQCVPTRVAAPLDVHAITVPFEFYPNAFSELCPDKLTPRNQLFALLFSAFKFVQQTLAVSERLDCLDANGNSGLEVLLFPIEFFDILPLCVDDVKLRDTLRALCDDAPAHIQDKARAIAHSILTEDMGIPHFNLLFDDSDHAASVITEYRACVRLCNEPLYVHPPRPRSGHGKPSLQLPVELTDEELFCTETLE